MAQIFSGLGLKRTKEPANPTMAAATYFFDLITTRFVSLLLKSIIY